MKNSFEPLMRQAVAEARGDGEWVRANCPMCALRKGSADRKHSLSFHRGRAYFQCWRCGVRGWLDGAERGDFKVQAPAKVVELDPAYTPLYNGAGRTAWALSQARQYLEDRGIGADVWARHELGAALHGKLRGRIIAPIRDWNAEPVGWVARDYTGNAERKYLNAKGMARTLYNSHLAFHCYPERPLYVVEGIFDALVLGVDAVACLGKPTADQLSALRYETPRPIVWALDGDAWEENRNFCWDMRLAGKPSGWLHFPPQADPGSLGNAVRGDDYWGERIS